MILSQNGKATLKGINLDLINDFNCIINMLMETNPEIFAATCASWAEIVFVQLPKLDKSKMEIVQMLSDIYIEQNVKEKADND